MSAVKAEEVAAEEELVDYEEEEEATPSAAAATAPAAATSAANNGDAKTEVSKDAKKGTYVGIHSAGFRDFLLKPELLRAIQDCGFEHPSEVQHECIPQAILGMDVLCQAKSGMGKTAVFSLATLQQLEPVEGEVSCIVLGHTRELALQIAHEFERFSKYMPSIKTAVILGGIPIGDHKTMLENSPPHIIVGTPGRVKDLIRREYLKTSKVKYFVLDECDKMLEQNDMRRDVQAIYTKTPHDKQTMMFTATLASETKAICKKFMQNPLEVMVDSDSKLTLHGLLQYYIKLAENEKNRKLTDLLDTLEFNQVVIFVKSVTRADELDKLLQGCNFPSTSIHSRLQQEERIARYTAFKNFEKRILVATDLFGRGIDIERVNIVVNYDMAPDADSYLHRVGRAGRFGTKGLAVSFITTEEDTTTLNSVQSRFEVAISELPSEIEVASYMTA